MKTITEEQFKQQFGEDAYNQFGAQPTKQPGFLSGLVKDIASPFARVGVTGYNAVTGTEGQARDLPGLGKTEPLPPVIKPGGLISPEGKLQQPIDLGGLGQAVKVGAEIGTTIGAPGEAKPALKFAEEGLSNIATKTGEEVAGLTKNLSPNIMNRIARLSPKEEIAFKNTAGKTVGEYLTETGNFGDPAKIVAKEADKFVQSKNMVDEALAKLPGEYKVGAVKDSLVELIGKGKKISTPNVKADFLNRAKELLKKHTEVGLNNSEINEVKRLLEREVKLGYNKMMNPDAVKKATNLDSAIRNWQFKKAPELGLTNLPELNKQTQISKFLLNKLGDKIVGQSALNNVSLTDWIVLSGGDPTAVGGFLVKKFFSSKPVQAKIAKMLSSKVPEEIIKPIMR